MLVYVALVLLLLKQRQSSCLIKLALATPGQFWALVGP